jgi:hypothetical protein
MRASLGLYGFFMRRTLYTPRIFMQPSAFDAASRANSVRLRLAIDGNTLRGGRRPR